MCAAIYSQVKRGTRLVMMVMVTLGMAAMVIATAAVMACEVTLRLAMMETIWRVMGARTAHLIPAVTVSLMTQSSAIVK